MKKKSAKSLAMQPKYRMRVVEDKKKKSESDKKDWKNDSDQD